MADDQHPDQIDMEEELFEPEGQELEVIWPQPTVFNEQIVREGDGEEQPDEDQDPGPQHPAM